MISKVTGEFQIGIGATDELSLRVSVAALVRVLFEYPLDGELMLALERKATLLEDKSDPTVEVIVQPFGGAIRIRDLRLLGDRIGDFHFDSGESRSEQDFRIFIRPSAWEAVQKFCLQHLTHPEDSVLESDPRRELAEEFADSLGAQLNAEQYVLASLGTVLEENPAPTANIHARNHLTVRIYRIFEARILDPSLSRAMMINSQRFSNRDLPDLAREDAQNSVKGRANAVLTLPLRSLSETYLALAPEARNAPILFQSYRLDETVAAILDGVEVPKYHRL